MATATQPTGTYALIPLDQLFEDESQPRKTFEKGPLNELASSMATHGLLQPITVRMVKGKYTIVDGARRYRAAKLCGFRAVPCTVRKFDDVGALEAQLIANVQREGIAPMEEAEAYKRLQDDFKMSVDEIAERTGKSKAWVYARVKLTELGEEGRKALADGKITASTALLVARQPAAKQAASLEAVLPQEPTDEPLPARTAQERLQRRKPKAEAEAGDEDQQRKRRARAKKLKRLSRAVVEAIVDFEDHSLEKWSDTDLRVLALLAAQSAGFKACVALLERRKGEADPAKADTDAEKLIHAAQAKELRGIIVELLIAGNEGEVSSSNTHLPGVVDTAARLYGLDLVKMAKELDKKPEPADEPEAAE